MSTQASLPLTDQATKHTNLKRHVHSRADVMKGKLF